jgi:hypothetical protein
MFRLYSHYQAFTTITCEAVYVKCMRLCGIPVAEQNMYRI